MAKVDSTPKKCPKSAAVPETKTLDCYDRLVSEIATIECVRATLSEWDLSDRTDKDGNIANAELVLSESLKRLCDIVGDVESMQSRIELEVANV
jgi:hypothetical protein